MTKWSRYFFIVFVTLFLLVGVRAVLLTAEDSAAEVRLAPEGVPSPRQSEETKQGLVSEQVTDGVAGELDMAGFGPLSITPATQPVQKVGSDENGRDTQVDCFQLIANSELNVVELGDGTGTVEPWVIVDPIVYYWRDDSVTPPNFSLFMQDTIPDGIDEEEGDVTPQSDMFGQGFLMPENLVSVEINYLAATVNIDAADRTFGQFWHVDEDGNLPDNGAILFWESLDPNPADEGAWLNYNLSITEAEFIEELSGNTVALLFRTITDAVAPDESVYLDNITLEACVESKPVGRQIFLPNVLHVANATPVCVPPSENPRDEVGANRGFVQTNALCRTTMSQLDTQDYYTFTPRQGGSYTLQLRNLPPGTEWSGSIIQNSGGTFEYAPGPTGGQCRIATPGAGNKQVSCTLQGGREYVVKVSAGQYSGPEASYDMRIVR